MAHSHVTPNKRMKLTKRGALLVRAPSRAVIIQSRFAAYARCYAYPTRATVVLLTVALVALSACVDRDWFLAREVRAKEVLGTWQPPADEEQLAYLGGLILQVPLRGRSLVLGPRSVCSFSPALPAWSPPPGHFPRHPDGCHWEVAFRTEEISGGPVAVIDLTVSWEGRQRGLTFFVRQQGDRLELWARAGTSKNAPRAVFVRTAA